MWTIHIQAAVITEFIRNVPDLKREVEVCREGTCMRGNNVTFKFVDVLIYVANIIYLRNPFPSLGPMTFNVLNTRDMYTYHISFFDGKTIIKRS